MILERFILDCLIGSPAPRRAPVLFNRTRWPFLIREKCKTDCHLAIAYGLEGLREIKVPDFKVEENDGRFWLTPSVATIEVNEPQTTGGE